MTVSGAFEAYRLDCIVYRNQSAGNEQNHRIALKWLLDFLGDDIDIEKLTFEQVRNWKMWLDKGNGGHHRTASTVREYIIRLRVVLRHAQKLGLHVLDYELIAIPKRPEKPVEFLTKEQVATLIEVMEKPVRGYPRIARMRNCAIISLLYGSGIRAAELLSMNRQSIRDDNTFTIVGKGRKERLCFIDQRTRQYIDAYLGARCDANPALFIADQTGQRLSKSGLQIIFARARRLVDFTVPVHPHTLRHSFATNLLRNNANLRYTQVMLGHSSITTTQIYSHVVDPDLQRIYESAHTY